MYIIDRVNITHASLLVCRPITLFLKKRVGVSDFGCACATNRKCTLCDKGTSGILFCEFGD